MVSLSLFRNKHPSITRSDSISRGDLWSTDTHGKKNVCPVDGGTGFRLLGWFGVVDTSGLFYRVK